MGTIQKIRADANVLHVAIHRIERLFEISSSVRLSSSEGKDSAVLLHFTVDVARREKHHFSVLFTDQEAQCRCTVTYILKTKEMYQDVIETFRRVILPLTVVSGVSRFQPEWVYQEPGVERVHQPPDDAIIDISYFPFYRYAMTPEESVPAFFSWFAGNRCGVAILIGVRADGSLNRFMGLVSQRRLRYADDRPQATASPEGFYYILCPLYDWKTRGTWVYNARARAIYNPLYDLTRRAGVPPCNMRACESFDPEQRKGLWLYHVLGPGVWVRMCERVSGTASGALYADEGDAYFTLRKHIMKPPHHTWCSYAIFLPDVMPERTAERYRSRIAVYLRWYQTRGLPGDIPDRQENNSGSQDILSQRRICKTPIRNDFWYQTLPFSLNKLRHYERCLQRMKGGKKKQEVL